MNPALPRFSQQQGWYKGGCLVFSGGKSHFEKRLRFTIFGIDGNTQGDILKAHLLFSPSWPSKLDHDKQKKRGK